MISDLDISVEFRCPKCDRIKISGDIAHYEFEDREQTAIQLQCKGCTTYCGKVILSRAKSGKGGGSGVSKLPYKTSIGVGGPKVKEPHSWRRKKDV